MKDFVHILLHHLEDAPCFPKETRGAYHSIMSLIISQRIRFTTGRDIRKRIYEWYGISSLSCLSSLLSLPSTDARDKQACVFGLTPDKVDIMKRVHDIHEECKEEADFVTEVAHVKGVRPWTRRCFAIMNQDFTIGFPTGDKAVNREMFRLLHLHDLVDDEMACILAKYKTNGTRVKHCFLQHAKQYGSVTKSESYGILFSKLWNATRNH